jgi:hypothetical protein
MRSILRAAITRPLSWLSVACVILWCIVIHSYWRSRIPLPANAVIAIPHGSTFQGFSEAGEVVTIPTTDEWLAFHGPIQFWDPTTGRLVRQCLTEDDELRGGSSGLRLAGVRQGKHFLVVDTTTDKVLLRRDLADDRLRVTFSPDHQLAALRSGLSIAVCEVLGGRELWSSTITEFIERTGNRIAEPNMVGLRFLSGDLLECTIYPQPSSRAKEVLVRVNSRTGAVDRRFSESSRVRVSPNSNRLIEANSNGSVALLRDFKTGEQVASLRYRGDFAVEYQFKADSSELQTLLLSDGRVRVARWRAEDGAPLTPGLDLGAPVGGLESADRRYTATNRTLQPYSAPTRLVSAVNSLGISWTGTFGAFRPAIVVEESSTGHRHGLAAWGQLEPRPDRTGFVVCGKQSIWCYEFPPNRNWWWLATRSISLPLLLGLLLIARKSWKRRKHRISANSTTPR